MALSGLIKFQTSKQTNHNRCETDTPPVQTVNMSTLMMEDTIDHGDKVNPQMDPEPDLFDPRSSMQGFSSLIGKQAELMTSGPAKWQTPIETLPRFDIVTSQGYQPENPNEDIKSNSAALSGFYETSARVTEATRTDSKSTIPSGFSSSGSPVLPPRKHNLRMPKQQDSVPARAKKRGNKKGAAGDEDEEDDSKRKKHLERNRMAALKCRQKKTIWVRHLETQNTKLGRKHSDLQQEYTRLINEVTQLKNQLMAHGACNDPNIGGWIEIEAKRLVEKKSMTPAAEFMADR